MPVATGVRAPVSRNGVCDFPHSVTANTRNETDAVSPSATKEPSRFANLGDTFEAEISQLKGLAVATLFGIVRDIVTKSVPKPMEQQVINVIDGITVKLGGQPIRGRLIPEASESDESENRESQFGVGDSGFGRTRNADCSTQVPVARRS